MKNQQSLRSNQFRPVVGEVVRAQVLAGKRTARKALKLHALLGAERALAGRPRRYVAQIAVAQGVGDGGLGTEVLDHARGDGLQLSGRKWGGGGIHAAQSNLISRHCLIKLHGSRKADR